MSCRSGALCHAVALLDFGMAETELATIAQMRFHQIKVVEQVFHFVSDRGELFTLLPNRAGDLLSRQS